MNRVARIAGHVIRQERSARRISQMLGEKEKRSMREARLAAMDRRLCVTMCFMACLCGVTRTEETRNTSPGGSEGRPLCDRFMNAFNVAVWLLYGVLRPNLSGDGVENFAKELPLPVAGYLVLFALRQGHCEQDAKGRLYLRGWCCLSGVPFGSDVIVVDPVVRHAVGQGVRSDSLGSALCHCGLHASAAQRLPDEVNRVRRAADMQGAGERNRVHDTDAMGGSSEDRGKKERALEGLGRKNDDVVICCAVRTALCKANRGSFKDTAPELLLAAVFKEVVARTKVDPKVIGDIQIGMGQFIAELPYDIPLSTATGRSRCGGCGVFC
eukprot:Skav211666  [mRNA]  locus=scaffold216:32979:42929:+ [translate_table: standard]